MFENIKKEDYMGMISWSKTSCSSPIPLFGTEIKTDHPIKIEISHCEEARELNKNWYHSHGNIVEIEMSPIQWAEFLTNGNTEGVPCTLKQIEGKRMQDPKEDETFVVYNQEVEEHFDNINNNVKNISDTLNTLIESKKISKKNAEELESLIYKLNMDLNPNMNFIKDSFKEDMANIVMKGKAEFNAYVENRIREIGIETIKADSVKLLDE